MEAAATLFELFHYTSFLSGGVVLIGTALHYLDQWLDTDIAREQAGA